MVASVPPVSRQLRRKPPAARDGVAIGILGIGVGLFAGVMAAQMLRRRASGGTPGQSLRGSVVLITGGSRGLGYVLAGECLRRGARVAICARDQIELSRARTQLGQLPGAADNIFAIVCDVTDRAAVERTVRTVEQRMGGIDILVNNAGIITLGPMETMTVDDYSHAMKVHFWGPLYATLAALPGMKDRQPRHGIRGRIVNIDSIGGKIGVPHLGPYSASKFALKGLSESLHGELRKDGITVTTVCPGIMRTGGHLNSTYKGHHEQEYAWMNAFNLIPGFSVSAEYAARSIIEAAMRGQSEVVIGLPAKAAALVHGIAPRMFMRFEALAARLLPAPPRSRSGGFGHSYATGLESEAHSVLPRWLKRPIYRTAERHNQFAGLRRSGAARNV
jgi:NAD(P)-dependent dehydrogenase (short-subunit alcohol dehydrogenase family)